MASFKKVFSMVGLLSVFFVMGCATQSVIEYKEIKKGQIDKEFNKLVAVESLPVETPPVAKEIVAPEKKSKASKRKPKVTKNVKKKPVKKVTKKPKEKPVKTTALKKKLPELEDSEGFNGRRPLVDPFRVGEKITMAVTYFNMAAGFMDLEVKPFVKVNNKRSYDFRISIKSSKVFSYFYAVDDEAQTYVDFETLKPSTYSIRVQETKQAKDIRSFFNWKTKSASYWEKKVTKDKGEENKKKEWAIEDYSQNVISALFYLRTFELKPGKELAFRVADAGENLVFTGKVLRREKLKTKVGTFNTVVVKPKIQLNGVFKPMGDIFIWLTDDDRKLPVQIESKIKIGTIITRLVSIDK